MLTPFAQLPARLQSDVVRRYYDLLAAKRGGLAAKRAFDIVMGLLLIVILSPLLLLIALAIKLDSRGPVFYRQQRVTQDMRLFRIFKFRTMVTNADVKGPLVTVDRDARITQVGRILRRARLDELPQLLNVVAGNMSFVGVRPEVPKYVNRYTDEMCATLLLPAGVTSPASIAFKDEESLIRAGDDADEVYVNDILPKKMVYNLRYLEEFSFFGDIGIMLSTLGIYRNKKTGPKPDDHNRQGKE